ncbi:hypothetical protein GCM10023194_38270 [Planotetraspora phitsanulokensis]|uniref:Uncharacterized protein n=1 Tax=Planotetraspora phitsanulokensis TaxID=575192 RepID=A0A8J3XHK1_9ACTN|nr:hypothetical protein [Planotetraspora phitsanulokensis]GII41210.1 hypothetical protein Pph01_62130 [Planotetraspora phitsanulokensis]
MTSPRFLMEPHVPSCAVPNGSCAEHIPQLGAITHTGPPITDGRVRPPAAPVVGVARDLDAADLRVG